MKKLNFIAGDGYTPVPCSLHGPHLRTHVLFAAAIPADGVIHVEYQCVHNVTWRKVIMEFLFAKSANLLDVIHTG